VVDKGVFKLVGKLHKKTAMSQVDSVQLQEDACGRKKGDILVLKSVKKGNDQTKQLKEIHEEITVIELLMKPPSHSNIIAMWCKFENLDELGYAMDLISGGDLRDFIFGIDEAPLTEEEVRSLFWPIFDAVAFMHAKGYAHRDLKPENVMMAESTEGLIPIVADLGQYYNKNHPSSEERTYNKQAMCGTKTYSSFELLALIKYLSSTSHEPGEKEPVIDPDALDAYSLGVMMLEVALDGGQPPPETEEPGDMPRGDAWPDYLDEIPDRFSPEFKQFVASLLELDPEHRPKLPKLVKEKGWLRSGAEGNQGPPKRFSRKLQQV